MIPDTVLTTDEEARALAVAVRSLDAQYRAMRARACEHWGISLAELDALAAAGGPEPATAKMIAAATGLTTSATTALMDRLTSAGLVSRERHPRDRRSVVIRLTEEGEHVTTALSRDYVQRFERLVASGALGCTTVRQLMAALACVTDAVALDTWAPGGSDAPTRCRQQERASA